MKQIIRKSISFPVLLFAFSRSAFAQTFGTGGGDQITTTVNTAGDYLQKLALSIFVIMLIVGAVRMGLDPQHQSGVSVVVGCIIGILITVLAPVLVQVIQGWAGGVMGF